MGAPHLSPPQPPSPSVSPCPTERTTPMPVGSAAPNSLADWPEFADLVTEYEQTMPAKSAALRAASGASDWPTVVRLLHQLAGSAGTFGHDTLTATARHAEREGEHSVERMRDAVEELCVLCDAVGRQARAADVGALSQPTS